MTKRWDWAKPRNLLAFQVPEMVWDRLIRSLAQLDNRVCCGRILLLNLIFQILTNCQTAEQRLHVRFLESLAHFCGIKGTNLRYLLSSFGSFFSHQYPLIMVHQFAPGDLRVEFCPILDLAWPSHISWQVQFVLQGGKLSFSPGIVSSQSASRKEPH